MVESYKATYGHKAVVLMSVVEGRAEKHLLDLSYSAFDPDIGSQQLLRSVGRNFSLNRPVAKW